ncbi:hypothetical protein D082_29050 [Synechocystis sp. PCC 6714]|nr:hypothetical protein D082_29050 [Synechocystis sp. PCC 6714]
MKILFCHGDKVAGLRATVFQVPYFCQGYGDFSTMLRIPSEKLG